MYLNSRFFVGGAREFLTLLLEGLDDNASEFVRPLLDGVDDKRSHIKAVLQNVILRYGDIDFDTGTTQGQQIAEKVAMININGINVTQSNVWCPLIWAALRCAGYMIPRNFFDNYENQVKDVDTFEECVRELANLPGWDTYAINVLVEGNTRELPQDQNNFESNTVIRLSNYYKNQYTQKYLKYKQKYLKLRNKL